MAVDGQLVARTVGELRATLPQAGDLLVGLGRVVEATRTVVGVDGTGLTLAHEDGQPRWVAVFGCGHGAAGADPARAG
jgi:hypothetical protein